MVVWPITNGYRKLASHTHGLEQQEVIQIELIRQKAHFKKEEHVRINAAKVALHLLPGEASCRRRSGSAKGRTEEDRQATRP